jgi:acetyltransferase-like isoleucine patch superfamily enzyme
VAQGAAFGLGATIDIFFPENIEVGKDAIIGYNTVLLGHEFLQGEYRTGKVEIGERAMLGANCTVLPGVKVGSDASVSAMSLVNRDIPAGGKWGGVPVKRLAHAEAGGRKLGGVPVLGYGRAASARRLAKARGMPARKIKG